EALKKIPWGRFGECSEVAEVVLFLSSDRCQYLTGQTINIDGGMVMR
ncbi:MAG: SDR family oxidoreductase, partial [Candidatus Sericytochromatia bacterium]